MGIFSQLKEKMAKPSEEDFVEEPHEEYVELSTDEEIETSSKMIVRPFTLDYFEDIKPIVDAMRTGNTIALINIRPLKEKDISELKRAVEKLRKTCDALEGEIAGFTENLIIATPAKAKIHKVKKVQAKPEMNINNNEVSF
ncbi:cell division protein SepF [Candidatus Woesearchaeota archaeon]|nr:cell division protein SepF [Candidatus Woesearchaeota archaeon]